MAAIGMMTSAIANVLFPAFSSLAHDSEKLIREIKKVLRLGTFVVAPISLLCAVVAKPLIILLLTEKWAGCVPIFQLCCITNSVLLLQLVNLRAYMALGHSGLYLKLQIWKVCIEFVVVCAVALTTRDIVLVAVATCICELFSVLVIDLWPAKRILGYGRIEQLRDVSKIYLVAVISTILSFLSSVMIDMPALSLLVAMGVFVIIYIGGAKLLKMPELSESRTLLRRVL